MIKIEDGKLYMTAGEVCFVVKNSDALRTAHFGKRIEPEDDLDALFELPDTFESELEIDGKPVLFEYASANVLPEKPMLGMGLVGGKTLQITAVSGDVTADIYYTPYPRGGFSRRAVVTNNGQKPIVLTGFNGMRLRGEMQFVFVTSDGRVRRAKAVDRKDPVVMDNFIAAEDGDGGAYGFLCVYGDGAVSGKAEKGVTQILCAGHGETVLSKGESCASPEILAVYSDGGIGGMSRVLHDILRENAEVKRQAERKPIVLFCPTLDADKLVKAAGETSKLGCDVFAVDAGEVTCETLASVSAACKTAGIKLGIRLSPFDVKKSSAVFNDKCTPCSDGKYHADITTQDGTAALYAALKRIITENDIEYVMLDIPFGGMQRYARGMHGVRYALSLNFPELTVERGIAPDGLRRGLLLCYPPCMTRFVAAPGTDGTLKAAFDMATAGCLSYSLDPLSLTPDLVRAVRAQVFSYQDVAPAVMNGDLYVLSTASGDDCFMSVTKDKSRAYLVCERKTKGNTSVKPKGLDEHDLYNVRELGATYSGAALVSCGVPIPQAPTCSLHIRQVSDYE